MERTTLVHADRLLLHYDIPPSLKAAENEIEALKAFTGYFEPDEYVFLSDTVDVNLNRIFHIMLAGGEEITEAIISDVLNGDLNPDTPVLQKILNVEKAIQVAQSSAEKKAPLSIDFLQQIHRLLTQKMPNAHCAGLLRTKSNLLFNYIESGSVLPEGSRLNNLLEQTIKMANDKKTPLLIRCWLTYYSLMSIQPFYEDNETVAVLACRYLIEQQDMNYYGLLNLEKHIFYHKGYQLRTSDLFSEQNLGERLDTDLTGYIDACLRGFMANLAEIKTTIIKQVRTMLNYEKLNSRQKNNMNFWLEKGFFRHHPKLKMITERQHEVLMLLARYVSLATKDLVPVFKVDRKTIQRDFTELMEHGIVESRGSGRNLRYYLDFRTYC
jgi:Fic family protein